MPDWNEFKPRGFEYDFENDELHAHRISVDEADGRFNKMIAIKNIKTTVKEKKIDTIVKEQAFDENAWELDSKIEAKTKPTSIRLSSRTINRARFFADIYHQRGYQSWLKRVIEDRINTEYELYKRLKKHTESH